MAKFKCLVCGYVHEGEAPPERCPVCNVPPDQFERLDEEEAEKSWRCTICGFVHVGEAPCEICPVCGVDASLFELVASEDDMETPAFGKVVIIGAGAAGFTAAETICRRTSQAEVTLISDEEELPYYRINLTRYLAGEVDRDDLTMRPEDWFADKGVNLWLGKRVQKIDRYGRLVHLENGTTLPYDGLILAMGAQPFVPPVAGRDLPGVTALRTAKEVDGILEATKEGDPVAVVGAGILGLEIAGALNSQGRQVVVISNEDRLMSRQLTKDSSDCVKAYVSKLGISLREDAWTKAISEIDGGLRVTFESGEPQDAKAVIFATGVIPDLALAEASGLETNRGIIVNDQMRTSDPVVYAAGDVVEHHDVVLGHWYPAQRQGGVAGVNVTGGNETFDGMPQTAAIKVLGIGVFSVGDFDRSGDDIVRITGDVDGTHYDMVFENNRLVGANEVGEVSLSATLTHLVESHSDLSSMLSRSHDVADIVAHLNNHGDSDK